MGANSQAVLNLNTTPVSPAPTRIPSCGADPKQHSFELCRSVGKHLHVSGLAQFKPVSFKGHMYTHWKYMERAHRNGNNYFRMTLIAPALFYFYNKFIFCNYLEREMANSKASYSFSGSQRRPGMGVGGQPTVQVDVGWGLRCGENRGRRPQLQAKCCSCAFYLPLQASEPIHCLAVLFPPLPSASRRETSLKMRIRK